VIENGRLAEILLYKPIIDSSTDCDAPRLNEMNTYGIMGV
jgi:hypothetical protein